MNVVDTIYPDAYKVTKNYTSFEPRELMSFSFTIIDEELDPLDVCIDLEGLEIDTKRYSHISLGYDNIFFLLEQMEEFDSAMRVTL